jgi:hypothetical protein
MKQGKQLALERCPHCNVAQPLIEFLGQHITLNYEGYHRRLWATYACSTCGGVILACSQFTPQGQPQYDIDHIWPAQQAVADELPGRTKTYLSQAIASIHAPVGAIVTAASAVDAMLKAKNYKEGTLYSRIEQAAKDHLITNEMAAWAHEVRLDANDQRHADEEAPLPSSDDAERVIEFAQALGQFLFVLPARVARGRERVDGSKPSRTNRAQPV